MVPRISEECGLILRTKKIIRALGGGERKAYTDTQHSQGRKGVPNLICLTEIGVG